MRSLKVALFAGAAIAAAFTSANAADLPPIMGPQPIQAMPVAVADTGGWYLRGDIGIGVERFTEFDHTQTNSAFVWPASSQSLTSPFSGRFGNATTFVFRPAAWQAAATMSACVRPASS